jgi:hypothetical protein
VCYPKKFDCDMKTSQYRSTLDWRFQIDLQQSRTTNENTFPRGIKHHDKKPDRRP